MKGLSLAFLTKGLLGGVKHVEEAILVAVTLVQLAHRLRARWQATLGEEEEGLARGQLCHDKVYNCFNFNYVIRLLTFKPKTTNWCTLDSCKRRRKTRINSVTVT